MAGKVSKDTYEEALPLLEVSNALGRQTVKDFDRLLGLLRLLGTVEEV